MLTITDKRSNKSVVNKDELEVGKFYEDVTETKQNSVLSVFIVTDEKQAVYINTGLQYNIVDFDEDESFIHLADVQLVVNK